MLVMEGQARVFGGEGDRDGHRGGEEHQRNPDKVSSHLQLHPFVFPQLLSFPSRLCVYSIQPSSMLANSASVLRLGPGVALEG